MSSSDQLCSPLVIFSSKDACPVPKEPLHWVNYIYIVLLVLVSAVFNMLNIGLMGLDTRYLELI